MKKLRTPRYVTMNGKKYKVTHKGEAGKVVLAKFKTKYGWKEVKNRQIKIRLYKKLWKQ